jgi:hypothetical protein
MGLGYGAELCSIIASLGDDAGLCSIIASLAEGAALCSIIASLGDGAAGCVAGGWVAPLGVVHAAAIAATATNGTRIQPRRG